MWLDKIYIDKVMRVCARGPERRGKTRTNANSNSLFRAVLHTHSRRYIIHTAANFCSRETPQQVLFINPRSVAGVRKSSNKSS